MLNTFLRNKDKVIDNNGIFINQNLEIGGENNSSKTKGVVVMSYDDCQISTCIETFNVFKNHFKNLSIYDVGYLLTKNPKEIVQLITHFNQNGFLVIIIGLPLALCGQVVELTEHRLVQVANKIELLTSSKKWINSGYIGYQRHLNELEDIIEIEEHALQSISLGKMRAFPYLLEPKLRDAQSVFIDLNVVRSSDCPNLVDNLPTGLHAEELCQLMKYVGNANQVSNLMFYAQTIGDTIKGEASLIAESIWYFLEGLQMCLEDNPRRSNDFTEFLVTLSEFELRFIKHNTTSRWWLCNTADDQTQYLPCAIEEYQSTLSDDIPERFTKFLQYQD